MFKALNVSLKCAILSLCLFSMASVANSSDEELTNTWKDPVMGWTWTVQAIAVDWEHAMVSCPAGSMLPDQGTLRYSVKRLKTSVLANYFKQYDIAMAWTNEEFDWMSAMAVHVFHGFSRNVWKRDFLAVLCVQK